MDLVRRHICVRWSELAANQLDHQFSDERKTQKIGRWILLEPIEHYGELIKSVGKLSLVVNVDVTVVEAFVSRDPVGNAPVRMIENKYEATDWRVGLGEFSLVSIRASRFAVSYHEHEQAVATP